MISQSTLLGAAGEHFALSQLLRRGLIAAHAPAGVPNADILITDIEGNRLFALQVKTRRDIGSDGGWHMKEKHEKAIGKNLFYCFVDFGRNLDDQPKVYIIPSKVVAKVLTEMHLIWLKKPGKKGQRHKEHKMRRLLPDYTKTLGPYGKKYPKGWLDKYFEAWSQLKGKK